MKKLQKPKWKTKRRQSFHFYFTIFIAIIICISVTGAAGFTELTTKLFVEKLGIPKIIVTVLLSLIIGFILSHFVGKIILAPIKRIRNAMSQVSEGNFDVAVKEESCIDEIEDINHAFNIMVKELRSTETIQSDFVSNVSHEFKTPLTAIDGYTSMLQSIDCTKEERLEYTEKILFNTKRMSNLVNNILLLSKLDNQGIEIGGESFSLDEQIRREILLAEPAWSEKHLDFDVRLEPVVYTGSSGLLSHVWSNLLSNAVKFSPVGGTIALELKKEADNVTFSIADQGEGIKKESEKYIFDKFYQSDTSHKQEGNGLGLALVKKITDIYGGTIEVENTKPKGCKFTVKLPLE